MFKLQRFDQARRVRLLRRVQTGHPRKTVFVPIIA